MRRGIRFLRSRPRLGVLALSGWTLLAGFGLTAEIRASQGDPAADEVIVIRCGRIETGTGQVIEKGAILVVDGKIEKVGRDLKVPVGAREIDASSLTVVPGFVHVDSTTGQDRMRSSGNQADQVAAKTFYPYNRAFKEFLKNGITTMAVRPSRSSIQGILGRVAVVQPTGEDGAELPGAKIVKERGVLCVSMNTTKSDKDLLRKELAKVATAVKKLEDAKKKWEEKQKKKKTSSTKKSTSSTKKDETKKVETKKDDKSKEAETFKPPKVDAKTQVIWDWVEKKYSAIVYLSRAADFLHWEEVVGDRDLPYAFHMSTGNNHYLLDERIAGKKVIALMTPRIGNIAQTANKVNPAAIFEKAGMEVGFIPVNTTQWRHDVAQIVRAGFPREKAIAAMSTVPAKALGIDKEYGSIQPGRYADLVFFDGDLLEVLSSIDRVMVRGKVVYRAKKEQ